MMPSIITQAQSNPSARTTVTTPPAWGPSGAQVQLQLSAGECTPCVGGVRYCCRLVTGGGFIPVPELKCGPETC